MFPLNRLIPITLILFLAFQTSVSAALSDLSFQTHGFLTQSYIKTDNNNFFGQSTGYGSIDYREFGINSSIRPFTKLKSSAQIIYRDAGATEDSQFLLDFALIDYQLLSYNTFSTGIRAGRIKNPMGFYNDTRDVAFTRPGIILPQSIYFDQVRDMALSSDGFQSYTFYTSDLFDMHFQLALGYPRLGKSSEVSLFSLFSLNPDGNLSAKPSYIGRLSIELFRNRLKLSYSDIGLYVDYLDGTPEGNANGSFRFTPKIFSIEASFENLVITSEYALRNFSFEDIPLPEQTGESYYFQLAYFLTPKLKLVGRYDVTYLNRDDKTGEGMELLSLGTRPAFTQFAKDYSVGIQWNIGKSWLIMVEQHRITGTAWLPIQDNPNITQLAKEWWMFSGLVSYRF